MVDAIRLGQLSRIATLRRDRNEVALAEASSVRAARESAVAEAQATAEQAAVRARAADRSFATEPSSDQAQLWRRVQFERAAEAKNAVVVSVGARDAAIAAQDVARSDLMRADARLDRTNALHARAQIAYNRLRDEREAEDRGGRPTRLA